MIITIEKINWKSLVVFTIIKCMKRGKIDDSTCLKQAKELKDLNKNKWH